MALRNKYLHAYSFLPAISHGRLLMGIFVGLLFGCCFYAFLYVCREALRILFFMAEDYDVLVLSDATVYFYNFILAYIATVLGQSLCFICWFEISLRKLGKYASQMRAVINDQRSMNLYFLSWFSRLAYVFALLIGGTMGEELQKVSNIPKHVHDLYTTATGEILFNGTSTYAEYIFIVSTIMQVIHELRNDYSYEFYQRIYENLEWDEAKVIRERFPYRVVEIPIE